MIDLIQGDCREALKSLDDGSVDAIVTDPPYGQTNETYDGPIAFDPEVWRECYRVAKPNAALVSFAGSPTYHRIASAIEAGGWHVRQMWGWVYRDGFMTSAWPKEGWDRLTPAMDPICYATKGKVILRLTREGKPWVTWHEKKPTDSPLSKRSNPMLGLSQADGHWPRTIVSGGAEPFEYFALPRTSGRYRQERTGHPNQKPLALMEWIISKLPAEVILDPFMGSATTGVVCQQLDREFIGIESDPGHYATARKRIAAESRRTPLFDPSPA